MTERLKPGDVLFYQRDFVDEWTPREVVIEKVGRKWATLVDGWRDTRVEIETLELDGSRAFGRIWRSKQEWLGAKEADRQRREDDWALDQFYREAQQLRYRRPKDLHAATIREAAALLGIEIGEQP